ncbi:hypothetical protein AALA90_15130 [Lachnospiraceae bacterium 38-10]
MAFGTKAALFKTTGEVRTKAGDRTVATVGAVIERATEAAGLLEEHMVVDFLGNGGTIPSESPANCLKGSRMIKHGFDSNTFS